MKKYMYRFYVDGKLKMSCGENKKQMAFDLMCARFGKDNFSIERHEHNDLDSVVEMIKQIKQ